MTRTPLTFVPALVTLFLASSASALVAPAEECGETADCAAGYTCEKSVSAPPCDPDQNEPCSTDAIVEEMGYCVLAPETCASDTDCGEYESCQSEEALTCWQSSDGSSGCEEADPDARSYCAPIEVDCTNDTDCPREFECVLVDDLCDCPEGDAECSADCSESDEWACRPKAIDCTSDDQCPPDWSCSGGLFESCSGGGSTGSTGAGGESTRDEPAPDEPAPDSAEPDADLIPTECTTETVVGECYPTVWDVPVDGDSAGEDGDDPGTVGGEEGGPKGDDGDTDSEEEEDLDEASSDAGGCSVTRAPSSGVAPWLLSLLLLVPFARRRRAAVVEKF